MLNNIILMEECGELIQILSKIERFGIDDVNPKTNVKNRDNLIQEMGDVLYLIDEVSLDYKLDPQDIFACYQNKGVKLEKWEKYIKEKETSE